MFEEEKYGDLTILRKFEETEVYQEPEPLPPPPPPEVKITSDDLQIINQIVMDIHYLEKEKDLLKSTEGDVWKICTPLDRHFGINKFSYSVLLRQVQDFAIEAIAAKITESVEEKKNFLLTKYGYRHEHFAIRPSEQVTVDNLPNILNNTLTGTLADGSITANTIVPSKISVDTAGVKQAVVEALKQYMANNDVYSGDFDSDYDDIPF